MEAKNNLSSATILENHYCSDCGWPVIDACCNDKFGEFAERETGVLWDYWNYCSNKGCKNHIGEGIFQDLPKWIAKK